MKKLFKIVLVLVAAGALLFLAGTVALRIYLPPEKAKALVLERLSAQLKRQVELGSASVGIVSGLQMTNLKISESPDFSKGTFLSSDQFSLKIALVPLLFRKMVVRQIVLKRPEVAIIRNADGKTFNFSDLTTETASSPTPAKGGDKSLPFLLLVSKAEIQKGALHFIDRSPARQSLEIAPFDLKLNNVSLTSPFGVQTSLNLKYAGEDVALALSGQANLLNGTFVIKQGSLAHRQARVLLSGEISRLKTADPAVNLKIDVPPFLLSDLAPLVSLPPAIKMDKPLSGSVTVKGDQKTIDLELQTAFRSIHVSGHGQVREAASKQPSFKFHLETNAFPVEEALSCVPGRLPPGVELKGATRLSADLSGSLSAVQLAMKWIGTDLSVTQGTMFAKPAGVPLELSLIADTASLSPLKILIKTMTLQLASCRLTGTGDYEASGKQAFVHFSAKGSSWLVQDLAKVSPLLASFNPTGTLSFALQAAGPLEAPQTSLQTSANVTLANIKQDYYEGQNAHLQWDLTEVTPDLAKVSGSASLKHGPGKILNVEKLAEGSRIGKILLSPLETLEKIQKKGLLSQMNIPSLQSIPFDSIVGDYALHAGVMEIRTFDLSGKDLSIQDRGTAGLSGNRLLNMKVAMKLAAGAVGGTVGQLVADANGRPTLNFTVIGPAANPSVKLDLQEVEKKAIQEVGKQILNNKDVQNAVDNVLKGIFH